MKKILSLLLAVLMVVGMFPMTVFAEEGIEIIPGEAPATAAIYATKITVGAAGTYESETIDSGEKFTVQLKEDVESIEITLDLYAVARNGITRSGVKVGDGEVEVPKIIAPESQTAVWTGTVTPVWENGEATVTIYVGSARNGSFMGPLLEYVFNFKKTDGSVSPSEVKVESVSLNQNIGFINVGETLTLTETVLPKNATNKNVTWGSSDSDIAKVENGVVTAVAEGKATITVTTEDGNKIASCEVVVAEPQTFYTGNTWPLETYLYISQLDVFGAKISYIEDSNIYLESSTADDAELYFKATEYQRNKNFDLGIYWNGSDDTNIYSEKLIDGKLTLEIRADKLKGSGVNASETKTFYFYIGEENEYPVLAEGYSAETTAEIVSGEIYNLNLGEVFTDADGDELTYTVSINGAEAVVAESEYSYSTETPGTYTLVFTATDGKTPKEKYPIYTVNLTVTNLAVTYDVNVKVPNDLYPEFFAVNDIEDGVAVKGDELVFENGIVKVPENISRIMWEAEGKIGFSAPVSSGANLELVEVGFDTKLDNGEEDSKAKIEIIDSEGTKISGTAEDIYVLPTMEGFTYKATPESYEYQSEELKNQTPASGKIGITFISKTFAVVVPEGSVVSAGEMTDYYKYMFNEPYSVENSNGNVIYKFKTMQNSDGSIGGSEFIRIQNPDGVTYWNYSRQGFKNGQEIIFTEEMLFIGENDGFDADTIFHNFEEYEMDVADIYLNVNKEMYIDLDVSETFKLNVIRNWMAIESISNACVALPDVTYTVIDENGNASDVVSVKADKYNSSVADVVANKEGTAIVLVTYDAMYHNLAIHGAIGTGTTSPEKFSAIWPENTGVLVVSVGADGTSIETNMDTDAEHDPIYYVGDEGAEFAFTPEEGCKVSVARATLTADSLTYNGFVTEGVTVNEETGEVTVTGLTQGRHIIRVEKDGIATYQIITTKQTTMVITDNEGNVITEESEVMPGTELKVQFGDMYNPMNKLSGIYNTNCGIQYDGEDGTQFGGNNSGYGHYTFASEYENHVVTIKVPENWTKDTYTLVGSLHIAGFGSGEGSHRGICLYETGRAVETEATGVSENHGVLPTITLNVYIPATEISLDKTELELACNGEAELKAIVVPEYTTDEIVWASSDEKVATVDENGKVTAVGAGEVTVTATAGDVSATCTITVAHDMKAATCTEPATCKRGCGYTEGEALGHDYKYETTKEPTCTEKGEYRKYCANGCGEEEISEIEALGHEWGEWKVVKEASYTEEGTKKRVCENDENHVETETIAKLVPTATEKTEGPDDTKEYVVAYQEGVVMVPAGLENEYPNQQAVKDALKAKVENGNLKGEVNLVFREVTVGYYENGAFVPVSNREFFENGKTIDILLKYPEGADKNDKFEVYHLRDDGVIEKCEIKSKTDEGLVIEVGSLSPFAIAYESVDNAPNWPFNPGKPSKPSNKPNPGITIITPEDEKEESNPNTGAPVLYSFDLTAAGVVVLAATAAVLEIKRRK